MPENTQTEKMNKEWTEIHETFEERIDKLKQIQTVLKTRLNDIKSSRNPDAAASAQYLAGSLADVLWYVQDLYELLDGTIEGLFEHEQKISSVDKDLRKHKPIISRLKKAMKETDNVLKGSM